VAFHRLVESTLDGAAISEYGEVHCFQYTNLNEGKSVVWFLYF
jgi:hypothetical protein